jgi:hypothetical protein
MKKLILLMFTAFLYASLTYGAYAYRVGIFHDNQTIYSTGYYETPANMRYAELAYSSQPINFFLSVDAYTNASRQGNALAYAWALDSHGVIEASRVMAVDTPGDDSNSRHTDSKTYSSSYVTTLYIYIYINASPGVTSSADATITW